MAAAGVIYHIRKPTLLNGGYTRTRTDETVFSSMDWYEVKEKLRVLNRAHDMHGTFRNNPNPLHYVSFEQTFLFSKSKR